MTIGRVSLQTVTRTERQTAVDAISNAVSTVGGWIDDVHFFSNISVAIRSLIPSRKAVEFVHRLAGIGLHIDKKATDALTQAINDNPADFEVLCVLQVTFFHNEPDLRREIPSVPG